MPSAMPNQSQIQCKTSNLYEDAHEIRIFCRSDGANWRHLSRQESPAFILHKFGPVDRLLRTTKVTQDGLRMCDRRLLRAMSTNLSGPCRYHAQNRLCAAFDTVVHSCSSCSGCENQWAEAGARGCIVQRSHPIASEEGRGTATRGRVDGHAQLQEVRAVCNSNMHTSAHQCNMQHAAYGMPSSVHQYNMHNRAPRTDERRGAT